MPLSLNMCPELPPLAWIATAEAGSATVQVRHGRDVEVGDDWFAEAVWDDSFDRDGLRGARNLFGSAGVWEDSRLFIRTSTALVDRVLTAQSPDRIVASNSLPLLIAETGIELDRGHDYNAEWQAILAGVDDYEPAVRTATAGWRVQQHYYGTVIIDPATGSVERQRYTNKLEPHSFADIEAELKRVVDAIASNARDPRRTAPMPMAATLSSGYDSTGSAALAASVGADVAYTRTTTTSLVPSFIRDNTDDGRPAAHALGMRVVEVGDEPSSGWDPNVELGLLAGSATFRELVLLPAVVELAGAPQTSLLFTGYHGDKNWDLTPPKAYLGTGIRRGDISGLTLAEARLHAGFINVALPFVGAESIDDFARISQSDEMAPWRLGGEYDRPIPRRIAEGAGVPREVFGQHKRAVWSLAGRLKPLHPELRQSFEAALHPTKVAWSTRLNGGELLLRTAISKVMRKTVKRPIKTVVPPRYSKQSTATFHWAVDKLTDRYKKALAA